VDNRDLTGTEVAAQPTDDVTGTAAGRPDVSAPGTGGSPVSAPEPDAGAADAAPGPVEPDAASTYTGPRIAIPTGMGQGPVYPTADQLPPPTAPVQVAGGPTPGRAGALLFWIGVAFTAPGSGSAAPTR
jgi:hypothetical protein